MDFNGHFYDLSNIPREKRVQMLKTVEQLEKRERARTDLRSFIEYMMPDPHNYDDVTKTSYVCKPVHKLMTSFWEEIDSGKSMRSALSVPPQMGKTLHTTLMGVASTIGRRPDLKIMVGTYNETKAKQNGNNLRRILESPRYADVFPDLKLETGGKSKSYLSTTAGGFVMMAGRGTGVTGSPCDIFVVDDPVKDQQEAQSTNALEEAWDWFSVTAMQRAHNLTRYVVIHTRWADNDLIGKLCDPNHPEYDYERAKHWTYLNVRAYDNDEHVAKLMEIEPESYIWPEKFSPELLEQQKDLLGAEAFSALYMGRPVPEEGGFFQKNMIQDYLPNQLPPLETLRIYAASDHAVTSFNHSNFTVLLIVGLDPTGQIWLLDCVRQRMPGDQTVEEIVRLMKKWRPVTWWAARDVISKSLGPYLKRRMREEGCYATVVVDSPEVGNKMQKAQSIRGAMAMGMVRFPVRASWYKDMVAELLRFRGEGDAQDDFVDALGHVGRGLDKMINGRRTPSNDSRTELKHKSLAWVLAGQAQKKAEDASAQARAGW